MNDGGDVGDVEAIDPAIERAVQQLLTRDEARMMSIASLVFIAIGLLLTVGWFVFEWRAQRALTGGGRDVSQFGASGGTDDPDVGDRIVRAVGDGFVLSMSLLVLVAGSGLRLFAGRLISQRQAIDELDAGDDDVVHEVTLDAEL